MPDLPQLEEVLVDLAGPVARVTLNRPDQRNPLSAAMRRDLRSALAWCKAEKGARVVVLTGAGDKAFCAGADLGGFAAEATPLKRHQASHDFVDLFGLG